LIWNRILTCQNQNRPVFRIKFLWFSWWFS